MDRQNLISILEALGKEIERSGDERDGAIAGCLYALTYAIRHESEMELWHDVMSFTESQMNRDKGSVN